MLRLNQIALIQFRNYLNQGFLFQERVVGICGKNGTGKTNLLDAIHYLSFAKSYFSRADQTNVHHGLQGLRLVGNYELNREPQELIYIMRENNRKELNLNGEPYQKFSDHLGKFPAVMIAPDDISLIGGASEERRKLVDSILSQINKPYLLCLIQYNKILQQRNSLLKQWADQGSLDETLLSILDQQLSAQGNQIYQIRHKFLAQYLPLVGEIYQKIAGQTDNIQLQYHSQLHLADMMALLGSNLQKDRALQRTSAGIHRDDLLFQLQDQPFKTEASQGQRKSLLFALKLAEWQILKNEKGYTPILLLDDVFEKLDKTRMFQLLQWVCSQSDGQVFITDTHPERLKEQMDQIQTSFQLIELNN
ncbi:MAG: DNA replication and repair protein RecF [Chitinophagaceae bacterium BSSC1]|nr:MAG: DNA replication and repair protein RecF [Chitinophagaceae bacterium BSSC1]